ncbi:unnamed protein product, partial [marine sediment metagenome]
EKLKTIAQNLKFKKIFKVLNYIFSLIVISFSLIIESHLQNL